MRISDMISCMKPINQSNEVLRTLNNHCLCRDDWEPMFKSFEEAAAALHALEDYRMLMQQPEPDLLSGAALIAQHRHPLIDFQEDIFDVIDDLAEQVQPLLPDNRYPMSSLKAISNWIYSDCPRPFRGNSDNFYDPDNSCINVVLKERTGIPITLCLVYMEVARRCNIDLYGVNIPGHFLLSPADESLEFFVDAFDGGSIIFLNDAEERLSQIYGQDIKLDEQFLRRKEQIPSRIFLTRMLNNLKAIYAMKRDYSAAYTISQYLRATRPGDVEEIKDAGFILWHMKRYRECAELLEEYINRAPANEDKDYIKVMRILEILNSNSDSDFHV